MKRLLTLFLTLASLVLNAQQEWVYNLSGLNFYEGISAAAGMYGKPSVSMRYRTQWLGVEGAPQTAMLAFHSPLHKNIGFGLRVKQDRAGAFNQLGALAHVSYTLKMRSSELRFALGGGMSNDRLLVDQMNPQHAEDPVVVAGNLQQWRPLLSASAMYRTNTWFLGAEAQRVLSQKSTWNGIQTNGEVPELLALGGFQLALSDDWSLRPLAAIRASLGGWWVPEVQLGAWYKNVLWFGSGLRYQASAYAFVEYRVMRKVRIAYSFGWPVMSWSPAQSGTHEIMLSYAWGGKSVNQTRSTRFFIQ
ncbi:MAG: hypothetical protein RL226_680 [Bacteroidota bacterium]|jgi:type IX secretion system PorP/SprF family membrane protein